LREKSVTVDTFKNRSDWKWYLQRDLGDDYEVFNPRMPNKENAKYLEWKIWFERLIQFIGDGVILIGHSRGGLFLIKYLSENKFPKIIKALILVSAPYTGEGSRYADNSNFNLQSNLEGVTNQAKKIFIFHSKDDPIVPVSDSEFYKQKFPAAKYVCLESEGHFNGPMVPGLIETIKNV
jgi:predicted alpha/beta hydrolase family esterase